MALLPPGELSLSLFASLILGVCSSPTPDRGIINVQPAQRVLFFPPSQYIHISSLPCGCRDKCLSFFSPPTESCSYPSPNLDLVGSLGLFTPRQKTPANPLALILREYFLPLTPIFPLPHFSHLPPKSSSPLPEERKQKFSLRG